MSKGIIYMIQPSELIGTNKYKIGCSSLPTLDRFKYGYKKGTRYIYIMECYQPFILEKIIINKFNKLFKLISGREYFEGDEISMKTIFSQIIKEYEDNILIKNESKNQIKNKHKKFSFEELLVRSINRMEELYKIHKEKFSKQKQHKIEEDIDILKLIKAQNMNNKLLKELLDKLNLLNNKFKERVINAWCKINNNDNVEV